MKITVITSSPHKKGTSSLLADEFIAGAKQAGHEVFRFDAAFEDLHPCKGCESCRVDGNPCVYRDAMDVLGPHVIEADAIVFVTPLYYFNMSAQLKTVIDRFYAINAEIRGTGKKAVLLATSWNDDDWTMDSLVFSYKTILQYLGWDNAGMVLASGCGTRGIIEGSDWPDKAFRLGKSLSPDSRSDDDSVTLV